MDSPAQIVGSWVDRSLPHEPERARRLLETTYSLVGAAGRLRIGASVPMATERYNGVIASTVARGLRHPEDSVLVNIFMPCEPLRALSATPLFPEAISVYLANTCCATPFAQAAEDHDVPETFCSYHKVMIGMAETGVLPKPKAIVNTTLACDANQVSFAHLAKRWNAPHLVVDVPNASGEEAVRDVAGQLRRTVAALEEILGRSFDEERLRKVMGASAKTVSVVRAFRRLRGEATLPMTTTGELCLVIATHCMLGHPASLRFANEMLSALGGSGGARRSRKAAANGGVTASARGASCRVPRIFWIHTLPNWQMSMRGVFDGAVSAELVGCDLSYESLALPDPEHPFESLARRIVESSNNGAAERRIQCALESAKQARADGAVLFCHWGCKQTMGLSALAKEEFEREGIPVLVLDGDGCDPRNVADGQMITRTNAFLEAVRS